MNLIRVTAFGLSMFAVPVLSGCSAAPDGQSEEVGTAEQAASTQTFRLPCIATGNWNSAGAHNVGSGQSPDRGGTASAMG